MAPGTDLALRHPGVGSVTARARIEEVHAPDGRELAGLEGLIERATAHDRHRPVMEHALIELKQGTRAFPHAAFVARVGRTPVAYAHLSGRPTNTGWRVELVVAPEWRGRGLGTGLMRRVLQHVAGHGGGRIHVWAYRPSAAHDRLAEALGMRPTRRLFRMERPLPAAAVPLPAGVTLRPFAPEDAPRWLALHNVVFADHPDGGGWRPQDLEWHRAEPWFDPAMFLLAEEAGDLTGYCWMKMEPPMAWVYFLGVAPARRGSGLAEALCAAGVAAGARRGATRAALYVDEDNEPAVRLYRRMGFRTHHLDVCYETTVAPAR